MLKIRELREEKGLTQKGLAEKIGVIGHNVGDWERNKCEPSTDMLIKIARVLEVSVDYLIGNSDDFGNVNVASNANNLITLSKDEHTLLEYFSQLGPFERDAILINSLKNILENCASVNGAVLFGSRARGDNRERSDYDVAIFGDVSPDDKLEIFLKIEELPTLLKIDVVYFDELEEDIFKQNILKEGKIFYDRT